MAYMDAVREILDASQVADVIHPVETLVTALSNGNCALLDLIEAVGHPLVDKNDLIRAKGNSIPFFMTALINDVKGSSLSNLHHHAFVALHIALALIRYVLEEALAQQLTFAGTEG